MPMASSGTIDPRLRVLAYGREKSKKTLWAAAAAEAGFNVVLINGEPGGTQILRLLSKEALSRVLICDVTDTPERAVFAAFIAMLCRPGNKFAWDEMTKQPVPGLRNIEHSFIEFDVSKLTLNDVIIFDSWTALTRSVSFAYAKEHNIDVTDAEKTDWDGYGYEGRMLDFVLRNIGTWNCHVFVIAHAYTYEKFTPGKGPDRKLISSTIQPISSSGPHGVKVPNAFNDVLYFDRASSEVFTIDTGGSKGSVGGSRLFKPEQHRWEKLQPSAFFNAVGLKATGAPCEGAKFIPIGTEQVMPGKKQIIQTGVTAPEKAAAPVLNAAEAAPALSTSQKPAQGGISLLTRLATKS